MTALRLLFLLPLIAACALVLACGDDDDDGISVITGSPLARTATRTPVGAPTATLPGEKSPPAEESPMTTPGNQTSGTPVPTAVEGTPAIAPADQQAFVAQFQGDASVHEAQCAYNPSTRITNCPDFGVYAVDPPLAGQDIACFVIVRAGHAAAIRCTSQEPLETRYYEIQE